MLVMYKDLRQVNRTSVTHRADLMSADTQAIDITELSARSPSVFLTLCESASLHDGKMLIKEEAHTHNPLID